MRETISFRWIKNGELGGREVSRVEMLSKFQELVKDYPDNNEIAIKMTEIIPKVTQIKINFDLNKSQDVPCIAYKVDNEVVGILKILRHHKIVWGILNKYCQEEEY